MYSVAGIEKKLLVAIMVPAFCLSSCCFVSSREANKLFAQAEDLLEKAQKAEEISYSDALGLYRDALAKLDSLTASYESTRIARKLLRGDAQIGPYTLDELKNVVVPSIEKKAGAEHDPDACMVYVIGSMEDAEDRARAAMAAAGYHEEAGRRGRAAELLSEALETVKAIEESTERDASLAELAGLNASVNKIDTALAIAGLIKDDYEKEYAFRHGSKIAD